MATHTTFQLVISIALFLGCAYWLAYAILVDRVVRSIRGLRGLASTEPAEWPLVSLIIPACNEAETLEAAMLSRLTEGYPRLEIILVDDRSTDGTAEVADRLAQADPRVTAVHIDTLPEGWLGKVHALQRGAGIATGAWLLFSDADVHFTPGALRKVISYAEAEGLDHIAVMPEIRSRGALYNAAIIQFIRLLSVGARFWEVNDPKSRAYMGVGAFNLVRKAALERTEGLAWLRLEPADDVALGMLLKRSGARCALLDGGGWLEVTWYQDFRAMLTGLEKGAFSTFSNYSLIWTLVGSALFLGAELSPLLALLPLPHPGLRLCGLVAALAMLYTAVRISRWVRKPLRSALLAPVGILAMALLFLRAGFLGHRRGGVLWRGTLYSSQQLREGKRVRIPL